ncbi:MAG: YbaB/EbfC family nucleoid-associated protein [Clostridia bacterium]|nr:YbaB/EbfC family nucleoid-associated protein [Clostridia bacterium]
MGKRNSFGFNGGGINMQQLMAQAQKMQTQMQQMTDQIEAQIFEASSGGGMVNVKINGKHEIQELNIKPEVVDPEDVEMLQDMIIAALNEAVKKADDAKEAAASAMMPAGMGSLGGLF